MQKFYYRSFRIFNISNIKDINKLFFIATLSIPCISCMLLFSTANGSIYPWAIKQAVYCALGLFVMFVVVGIKASIIEKTSYIFYFLSIFLLLAVKFIGHHAMGAQRWIDLKIFHLQPSEVAKVAVILVLSKYFQRSTMQFNKSMVGIIPPVLIVLVPFSLVVIQPDLATSLIIFCLAIMMIFVAGISIKIFITCGVGVLISAPVLWVKMHAYQQKRILNFLYPDSDPLGSGYNIIQSKIAIGSGGFLGKGFMNSWQSQLNFLPENQTDFIFSVLAEEFGLLGCLFVLGIYIFIISYGFYVSLAAKRIFLKMTSFGASCYFFLHVAINAGMATGILPAAGVPMPMLSYGGTSMLISMICIGLICNASIYNKNESYD